MPSPVQVTNDDIKSLGDQELVTLLWQLLQLELGSHGISRYDSHVPLSIYIKDGGIDGLAQWNDSPEKTTFLPSQHVGFQAKASDMSEADCESEVKTTKGRLKPQVRNLIESGGVYVLFLGRDCVKQSKDPRIAAIKRGIEKASSSGGEQPLVAKNVYIYDASQIAAWVNMYPAAVATVGHFLGHPLSPGKGWLEVSCYPDLQLPFVDVDEERQNAVQAIRQATASPRSVLRIIGASGLGKTRLVLEAFRPPPPEQVASAPEQARVASGFCYVSATEFPAVAALLLDWRRMNRRGTVVVDDCPFDLHERLAQEVRRSDSELSLITIGMDRDSTAYAGTETKLVEVGTTSKELISKLLEKSYGELKDQDREFIANELAQGFPLMAIRIAQARKANAPLAARLTPDVLTKLLGRPVQKGSPAERVISVCALFEYLGITGDVSQEREFARRILCPEVPADDFYANIIEFEKSGAITRYGRLVQVRPRPLAIRLAADWWECCSPELAERIIGAEFPAGLAKAFCERLRMLDFVPAVVDTTARLCGPQGPFGQAKVLNSDLGSELFRAIAEVNPVAAAATLERVFGSSSEDELRSEVAEKSRRNIVWALEKLCFRSETFDRAARFLLRLAVAENETWSNNATGVFQRLFMILLPGTQAPLEQRLRLLLDAASSQSASTRAVAVGAFDSALRTHHFSGLSGPEYQGSAGPQEQYRPKVWKEVFDYWSSCLKELTRLSIEDSANSERAASAIATNIRGLVQVGRIDDLSAAISAVAVARHGIWPEAMEAVKTSLRFDGGGLPEIARKRLVSWIELLEPTDLDGRLRLHVTQAPYEHEEDEAGAWRDLAAERAEALGVECGQRWESALGSLTSILSDEQRQAFMFGRGLGKGSVFAEAAFAALVDALEELPFERRNSAVLSGWLSALNEVDVSRVDQAFQQISNRPKLRRSLPSIARGVSLNDERVRQLTALLRERSIQAVQLLGSSYGQSMASASPQVVSELCQQLMSQGADGAWIALDVAYMFVYSDAEKWAAMTPTMKAIIGSHGMLNAPKGTGGVSTHAFSETAKKLATNDPELAKIVAQEVVDSVDRASLRGDSDLWLQEILSGLLEKQLETTWPAIAAGLIRGDALKRWRLTHVLRTSTGRRDEQRLISKVPLEYLARWCVAEPALAPQALAQMVEVMTPSEDGSWSLSSAAMMLIDNYGESSEVLGALGANLHSFTWMGSLVPMYERQVSVLRPLQAHRILLVRQWAESGIEEAKRRAKIEAERDAEQEVGRY